jgi:hypothetical protein
MYENASRSARWLFACSAVRASRSRTVRMVAAETREN